MIFKWLSSLLQERTDARRAFDKLHETDRLSLEERDALSDRFSEMVSGAAEQRFEPLTAVPPPEPDLPQDPLHSIPVTAEDPTVDSSVFDAWSEGRSNSPKSTGREGD